MWRFLKVMQPGDWVVVPSGGGKFYVAEILDASPVYDGSEEAIRADSGYRRRVRWLNDKQPLLRSAARSRLISRMKIRQTSANAKDLIDEIHDALVLASAGEQPAKEDAQKLFANEVRKKMVEAALKEIQQGYMDERKFEGLVATVLRRAGASSVEIVPRQHDKGVDIKATFQIGGISPLEVGVQAKYYKGDVGTAAVEQLIKGLKEEELTTGWLVTSGEIPEEMEGYLEDAQTREGLALTTVDGRQLAEMIIDFGLQDSV
jgi:predicted Mrr-cat superfamily restriction endonuclease